MSSDRPVVFYAMMFVAAFACFLLVVLFTAVTTVRADVIQPNIERGLISIEATTIDYDAATGVLTITDDTGAFTYRANGAAVPHLIYNLDNDFGGGYQLTVHFAGPGSDAPLDGLFEGIGVATIDLLIQGEIPTMGITQGNGYSGTLLTASVDVGELFAYSSSNASAEFNLLLTVTGGDLVTAGEYQIGDGLGTLSTLLSLAPQLPEDFDFESDFESSAQSGSLGLIVPEPATVMLLGLGAAAFGAMRRRRRNR